MTRAARAPLRAEALGPDPIEAFRVWFREAESRSGMTNPNAVCLSTIGEDDWPQGRMVLVKSIDDQGFSFFTNYESVKGRALDRVPRAALTFYWDSLGRQVRVTGHVERTSPEESDEYFQTRPLGSQVGAWASSQSEPVAGREVLEARAAEVRDRYAGREIPRPRHWGGYRLRPQVIEFWQEGADRLHDRIVYRRDGYGEWRAARLSP